MSGSGRNKSAARITQQHKRLGASCDWSRENVYPGRRPEQGSPHRLRPPLRKGPDLPRRAHHQLVPALRDRPFRPRSRAKDLQGNLWYVKYPFADGRWLYHRRHHPPGNLLGDTAVAVNPKTSATKTWIGKKVILPYRKPGHPHHRRRSHRYGFRHRRGQGNAGPRPGRLRDIAAAQPAGDKYPQPRCHHERERRPLCRAGPLRSPQSRSSTTSKKHGLLVKIEPILHAIGHCQRCRTMIEPMVSKQWFVKIAPLAEPAIEAVKTGG